MKILMIYTHPNSKSFNYAIRERVLAALQEAKHEIKIKDLYAHPLKAGLDGEDFGQIMSGRFPRDVQNEQSDILWAEGLIFIYPTWWFERPALLKGWIDRVFLKGFAYDFGAKGVVGLLKQKKALIFTTTGGSEEDYKKSGFHETLLKPMTLGTLQFCGIPQVEGKIFYAVPQVSDVIRKNMLAEAADMSKKYFD